jgi:SOS-response transcriptional repressor LexA
MMLAAYLEKLQSVSADAVESACNILSSRNEPFPPSAGQVFDKAREIEHRRAKADAESVPRIRYVAPFERLTEAQKVEQKRKIDELLHEIRASNVA